MGLISKLRHAARTVMVGQAWGQGMPPSAMSDGQQGSAPASAAKSSSLYVDHRDARELSLRPQDPDSGHDS